MFYKNRQTPHGLGVNDGRLAPVPASPNAVSSQTDDQEKQVAPFPFKGDLEFYFDESEKVIYFRSASRVGYSDMGLNKKRYTELMRLYRKN